MPLAMDQIEIVKSKTLASLVQERIIRLIRDGDLAPGAKLVEADFTSRLDVNRAAIREAFRALEEAGLVKLEKNRGVSVRSFGPNEAVELYEMRVCFEEMGTRRLAGRIADAQLDELRRFNGQLAVLARKSRLNEYYPINLAFHDRIIELAGHGTLLGMYRRLTDQMHLVRRRGYETGDGLNKSHAEHEAILDALSARNAEAAAEAARMHATNGMSRYVDLH